MKKTLHMLLLAFAFAVLSSAVHADEIDTFDETIINSKLPAIDAIFDASPNVFPSFTLSEDQFNIVADCSLGPNGSAPDLACIASANSAFSALDTTIFPGCQSLTESPESFGCFDQNVFFVNGVSVVEFTFNVEPSDLPTNPVPEPNTLLLMGTGFLTLVRLFRRKDWFTTLPPSV